LTKTEEGASNTVTSEMAPAYRWLMAKIGRSGCVAAILAIIFGVCCSEYSLVKYALPLG